jgi:hypothetical protein
VKASCDNDMEPPHSTKDRTFVEYLSDYVLSSHDGLLAM